MLAQVVASRGLQPEPVATDALTHVLVTSRAAAGALTSLVATLIGDPDLAELRYSTQVVGSEDAGRPDLVGADGHGPRLIVEAKFDAALTEAQIGTAYLDRLVVGHPGVLLFLVPEERIVALWPKLLSGPGGGSAKAASSTAVPGEPMVEGVRYASLPKQRTLAVISWGRLLDVLGRAVELAGDARARGDLEQLAGLVAWRSRSGWLPVQPGDLPDTAGRQLAGITRVMVQAAAAVSSVKVRQGNTDMGSGRWLTTPAGGWFWVGVWLEGWDRFGYGPLWATVSAQTDAAFVALTKALAPLQGGDPDEAGRCRTGLRSWGVPLTVPAGAERDDAHADLTVQLKRIAARHRRCRADLGHGEAGRGPLDKRAPGLAAVAGASGRLPRRALGAG